MHISGPDRCTYVSSLPTEEERGRLQEVLKANADVFAWVHSDMTGISLMTTSHKLNVLPPTRPVRQRVRLLHLDCHQIIQAEVDNLLKAGFIREVKYPKWLVNVVVVLKKGGKWRVCIYYTDLNDTCLNDSFPLPRIDQIVDASAVDGMLSFLDTFSGYHKIPMYPSNAEKTSFINPFGLFCYNVMPFGLKNVGATYQRSVSKMFQPLLGKTMEVYIDDMLIKSKGAAGSCCTFSTCI